ncbi:MAG: type 2 isopentenyl-diphosphate Delta-isomerase [Deltaproteobacteria bacterium]|nr:type 2 isopentenyl-diphosphate Delta-isomerase [Deltaproteobacteria bacterium]
MVKRGRSRSISTRKKQHLDLCATADVGFRGVTTLLEDVHLVHDALPELALDEVDLGTSLCGKTLRAPIVIASMTGGTSAAARINLDLAAIAEARGIAFGLGSQRAMHEDPAAAWTYEVRKVAPTALLLGNIGAIQASRMRTAEVQELVERIGADALCVHLNPAMEIVQPGGDRDFRGALGAIARLHAELGVPVVVKETGCGISASVGRRLLEAGIRTVDVSGAGGTSWVGVETLRARAGDRAMGAELWDWGIPTAASVALLAPLGFQVIATGGVRTGLDVARALALGAAACGVARAVLQAHSKGGGREVDRLIDGILGSLKAAMALTGSRKVADLHMIPRVIGGRLRDWLDQLA